MFVYTLELEGGNFYVGTTSSPAARLREHRSGAGSAWPRLHPPLRMSAKYKLKRLDCSADEARLQEDAHVKRVMLDEGINAVRGGSYSREVLSRDDVQALCRELFHATNACLRCGRRNHWARSCFATRDVAGNLIEDAPPDGRSQKHTVEPMSNDESSEEAAQMSDDESREEAAQMSDDESLEEGDDYCFRCGRPGHWIQHCYARTHANGKLLS